MQQIQNDCLKDAVVGCFELLWPKNSKDPKSNPTFINIARNVLEILQPFS